MSPAGASARKVVFVNRYFFPDRSATSQMLSDLAFGLAGSGFSVHVVCSRQLYDQANALLDAAESVGGVTVHRVWTTRFGRGRLVGRAVDYASFYLSSAIRLLRLVSRDDTLVAETDPPLLSIVAAAVATLKRARLVNWLHDVFPEIATFLDASPLPAALDGLLRRLRDASLRAAATNVVIGARMRERLRAAVPASKLCVIENWAPPEAEYCEGLESDLRAGLELGGKFVVGYSGNLGRAHDYRTLLEAAALCAADQEIVFLMIGAGAGMTALEEAARRRDLSNFRFVPLQPRSALADTLAAADLHWLSLLPALEGLIVPSKLYGILAARRPVLFIGDPQGEVAQVIGPAEAGLSVSIGDAAGLARHIIELKADRARLERMGGNAFRLYRERYTEQHALERWKALLGPTAATGVPLVPETPAHTTAPLTPEIPAPGGAFPPLSSR